MTESASPPAAWGGSRAVTVASGSLEATFLPDVGLLGVSLRHAGEELFVLPHGLSGHRAGLLGGLPLLAPWANRLSGHRYRVGDVAVDLEGLDLSTDDHGLPIHGTMTARAGWEVEAATATAMGARFDADARPELLAAFPFPHRLAVEVSVDAATLTVVTTLWPTGDRAVPVAFGWHPYLRIPGSARGSWTLGLPDRVHVELDERGLPTGRTTEEPAEARPIGDRVLDDLYRLDGDDESVLTLAGSGRRIDVVVGEGYPFAQVYVPPGTDYACLEPMAAPTDALVTGDLPLVPPGGEHRARFAIRVTR